MAGLVSVIVPAFNSAGSLRGCLEALGRQQVERPFEVIVVDDGSTDDTPAVCSQFERVRYLCQPNRGPAVARNLGVREARGEIVVFTDADCRPQPDWLAEMVGPLAAPEVVGVKGAYRSRQTELVARLVQLEYEDKYRRMSRFRYIDFVDTYSAAYRRDVFLRYRGFDERYRTASVEDQEFSFRLAAEGLKMVFNPRAAVWHLHAGSLGSYLRKKYKIGFWKSFLLRRHPHRLRGDTHTPASLKLQVLLAPAVVGGALAGLFHQALWNISGAALLLSLLSSFPFVRFAWGRDRRAALAAPFIFLSRSMALALGLLVGALRSPSEAAEVAGEGATKGPERLS